MKEGPLWVSMRRPAYRIFLSLKPTLALFGALVLAAPNWVSAQETSSIRGAGAGGIRHILYLTIKSDPDSRLLEQRSDEPITATLTVKTRISAHSQETNFYGDVPVTVSDFDLIKGSREQEVWKDAQCHHERGFPKISVINVDGSITNGKKSLSIAARVRWLGRLLPGDEVMMAKRLASSTDDVGPFIATRTETKQSRLFVDLKLYILPCSLTAAAN
jgi:hypothetical protein